jgi:hypothetical protein
VKRDIYEAITERFIEQLKRGTVTFIGGRGGIRTHGDISATLDFESSAFNRTQPPFPLLFKRFCGFAIWRNSAHCPFTALCPLCKMQH